MVRQLKGYISLLIVLAGAFLLNFADPPWQYVGVVVFLVGILSPVLEGIIDLIRDLMRSSST